jgi:hypothetical protein
MERILNLKKECHVFSGVLIGLVLLLPLVANSSDNASADTRKAKMLFSESEYVFDTTVEGKAVLHDFIIRNKGEQTLIIQKIKTG